MRIHSALTSAVTGMALASLQLVCAPAQAEDIKRIGSPNSNSPISQAVTVPANTRLTFVSGMLAEVSNPNAPKNSIESYGDTKTQTISILRRIEKLLANEGLSLGDVVKVNVFLLGDPKLGGKMDFAGLNAAYSQFFGSATQPHKAARATVQVAALAMPGGLVEIEMIAAKVVTAP